MTAVKYGEYGSMAVRLLIQAPPMPIDNNTNGPRQHADAPIAANAANNKGRFELVVFDMQIFQRLIQRLSKVLNKVS